MQRSKTRFLALAYLSGMVLIHAVLFWHSRQLVVKGYPDFTIYYCAGTMVRTGLGYDLYNDAEQYKVQRRFAPDVAIRQDALPYFHPPFEALIFAPLTRLPYIRAFIAWDLLNVVVLVVVAFLFSDDISRHDSHSWAVWVLAGFAFFPIFLTLLQGQDSIVLLLVYTLVFVCLKKKAEKLAGGFLALGLFRPQLILPFLFLWLIRGGTKILYGFLPIATFLALVSLAVVGPNLFSYPTYVLRLDHTMAQGALRPSDMPNLRGMFYILFHAQPFAVALVVLLSVAILLLTAWLIRSGPRQELFGWHFALALLTAVVTSYYCLGHDLSILLLPIALIATQWQSRQNVRSWPSALMICSLVLLFFSPMQLFLVGYHRLGIIGWAVLLLFAGVVMQIWPPKRSGELSGTGGDGLLMRASAPSRS